MSLLHKHLRRRGGARGEARKQNQRRALIFVTTGLILVAMAALIFGKFCLGSYIFHLIRGRVSFANATLPWKRTDP